MPPSYTQAQVLNQMAGLPDALPFGKLWEQANGGSNSILANVFRNTMTNPKQGYDRTDQQITTGAEAYFGSVQVISDTFSVMTLTDDNWLTKVFAPIVPMPENVKSFAMNKTIFKGAMASEVPHLGVPRLARSERHTVQATLDRIGFGYVMEHDFMNTREGLRYHLGHLQQMANAMLEAVKYDIMFTALDAYKFERDYIKDHNLYKQFDPDTYFSEQIWAFAILQKQKNGMEKMHAEIEKRMQQWRGVADTYIMPLEVVQFLNLAPHENISFSEAGPSGPGRLEDSMKPFGVLNKQPVYIARSYFSSQMDGSRQWLEDTKQFGEWYRMSNPAYSPDLPYRSAHRSIKIYSFPKKAFVEITMLDALKYSMLFDWRTGLPMYLDNPNFPYQSHLRGSAEHKDIFNYKTVVNGTTQYKHAHFFGEMELHYWTPSDKIAQAHSVVGALKDRLDNCSKTLCDFNDGLALLRRIQRIPYSPAASAAMQALDAAATVSSTVGRGLGNLANLIPIQQWTQDPNTNFVAVSRKPSFDILPPGIQSEGGLNFLIAYGSDALAAEKAIATRFLAAVKEITGYLTELFPDCLLLSPAYASSVQQYPSASSVFIDNLLLNGYNPPIFIQKMAGAGGRARIYQAIEDARASWPADAQGDFPFRISESIDTSSLDPATDQIPVWQGLFMITAIVSALMEAGLFHRGGRVAQQWDELATILRVARPNNEDTREEVTLDLKRFDNGDVRGEAGRILDQILASPELARFAVSLSDPDTASNFLDNAFELSQRLTSRPASSEAGTFVRTPFLASSAFAASLYRARYESNGGQGDPSISLYIADPRFPEVPATREIFNEVTRFYPERGLGLQEREMAGEALEEFNPAWNPRINEKLPIGSNSLFASIMAGHLGVGLNNELPIGEIASDEIPLRSQGARLAEEARRAFPLHTSLRPDAVSAPPAALTRLMELGERFFARSFSRSWQLIEKSVQNPLIKALAHIYDATPIHRDAVASWYENNVRIPFDCVVTRPVIEVKTLTIIKAKAGRDTIITAMAPGQFETGDDPITQWHVGTVTGRHKCMVISPENFYIWKNAFICGVNGGLGTEPITPADYDKGRGQFKHQDIMVIPLSPRDQIKSNIFSLTGDLAIAETSGLSLAAHGKYQHENCARVNKAWGFNSARYGINEEESAVDAEVVASWPNVLCHAGPHLSMNPRTGEFTVYHKGESYLTGLIHDECAATLMGRMEDLDRDPWVGYSRA